MKNTNTPEQIAQFIKKAFTLYDLSYANFFNEYDEEENKEFELPMIINGKLVMPIIERTAMCLGVPLESLLTMDDNTICQRYNQYPYFKWIKDFYHSYHESYFNEPANEYLCRIIFNTDEQEQRKTTFDYNDVKKRLFDLIDKYSIDFPDLKHEGKTLSYLEIKTETLFQYEHFKDLITSYLDMFDQFKALFFKTWDIELTSSEIMDYNFLVSCLGIRDTAYIRIPLYYDILKSFIPIYKKEAYKDIFSFIKVRTAPPLWKCANIADYPDIAKQFVLIYPDVKSKLRQSVINAKNYRCAYLWSDEKKPDYDPEYELYILGMLHDFNDNESGNVYHYLYVPKTNSELGETNEKIKKLSILSGSEALGGLHIPQRKSIEHLQAHINAAPKMKWGVELYE